MKKTVRLLFTVLFVAMSLQLAQAQLENLTYNVSASNFTFIDDVTNQDPQVTGLGNIMEFDIYILQTNVPQSSSEIMRFALGQYYLNVNFGYNVASPTAADTAGFAKFSYIPGSTDFANLSALPTNPHVKPAALATDGGAYYPPLDVVNGIRGGYTNLNSNNALGNSSDVQISNVFPGTKVGRYRLKKNVTASWPSPYFASVHNHMRWRIAPFSNPNNPNPVSKIFAYNDLYGASTDVTAKGTFIMDTTAGQTFPVELASFTATSNRNSVSLSWSTAREINNAGFDVERKLVTATDWTKVGNVAGNGNTEETRNFTFTDRIQNEVGTYNYRLKQMDFNGTTEYFNLATEIEIGVPTEFAMSQNYPNPFNPSTKINYDLPKDGQVSIALFDLTGRQVASLVNDFKTAGYYTVQFNATNLSSGMYFYRISSGNFVSTKKMVLIK